MNYDKRYIEGQDYVVRLVPFPNCSVDGAIMKGEDGLDYIYINNKVCPERQRIALQHELEHLVNDDLYSEDSSEDIEGRNPY